MRHLTASNEVLDDDPDRRWDTPGAYRVAPGVHRIPLPLPDVGLHAVNVYAIEDSSGLVLIDSGQDVGDARGLLVRALHLLDYDLRDVREFLVTHVHRDHYHQAVTVRRQFATSIGLGTGERMSLAAVADPSQDRIATQLRLLRLCGAEQLIKANAGMDDGIDPSMWEPPDRWLEQGPIVLAERTLTAVPTPGHTRGHLVFRDDAAGLLFAGDHILPHITPSIGFEPAVTASPLGDYLHSLRRVRGLPDTRLLPAHGPVRDSVHARVDELVQHHADRLEATYRHALAAGSTALEVAAQLRWTRHGRRLDELSEFNAMLAVLETMFHLDLLADQGRVVRFQEAGLLHYRPG